jgi:AraC-like DNA-binding protein
MTGMTELDVIEIAARGPAAVLCLLTSAALIIGARNSLPGLLGALFGFGAFSYMLCTSPALVQLLGIWQAPFVPFSWLDGVFFWWFCLALFCDEFRLRPVHFLPAIPIVLLTGFRLAFPDSGLIGAATFTKQAINAALIIHAIRFALLHRCDDLVDSRRRFRVVIAVTVGVSSVFLMGLDMFGIDNLFETTFRIGSSIWLMLLSFGFALWALQARSDMFAEHRAAPYRHDAEAAASRIDPADKSLLARLEAAMTAGAYRETGLTVGRLAEQLGTPEHRLRKLINGGLGYRNFSSYINAHRVEDAKEILADPDQARLQILQVALDLGYGSIASFNRAFREATGEAPTAFRRKALMAD